MPIQPNPIGEMAVQLSSRDISTLREAEVFPNSMSSAPNFFIAERAAVFLTPADCQFNLSTLPRFPPHPNLLKYKNVFPSSTGGKLLETEPVNRSLAMEIRDFVSNGSLWSEVEREKLEEGLRAGIAALQVQGFAKPDLSTANCYLMRGENDLVVKVGDLWTCAPPTETNLKQTYDSLGTVLEQIATATGPSSSPRNGETAPLVLPRPPPLEPRPPPPPQPTEWLRNCCLALCCCCPCLIPKSKIAPASITQ